MPLATLGLLLTLSLAAFAGNTAIDVRVTDDGASRASWTRDGVRYETYDRDVTQAVDRVLEKHRRIAREHREVARRHREIAREHARIGREHARVGRDHARGAGDAGIGRRRRELERMQEELEERQAELERVQDELEERRRVIEDEVDRALEEIFEKAVRAGKAKRTN